MIPLSYGFWDVFRGAREQETVAHENSRVSYRLSAPVALEDGCGKLKCGGVHIFCRGIRLARYSPVSCLH